MKYEKLTFNPFQENTYILYDDTGECVIIDCGCFDRSERNRLVSRIEINDLTPVMLLNTHAHLDHVFGLTAFKGKYDIPFYLHREEMPILKAVPVISQMYGVPFEDDLPDPDHFIEEDGEISFGNTRLKVLFTPGHSPGSVSFYHEESHTIIAGDVLFAGSIGRTDLPGGDYDTLISSIKTQLLTLPDHTTVLSGHGPDTTIGAERRMNPFLQPG